MSNQSGITEESAQRTTEELSDSQCLTFSLAGEMYAVDVLRVQEIRGWESVTRVPNVPEYVKGVLNLRGSIVPIYDLRQRFGLPMQEPSTDTVVVIMRSEIESVVRSIGVVVDSVANVHDTWSADLRNTPEFGASVPTVFIKGLVSIEGKTIMLLDVDRLLSEESHVTGCSDEAA